MEGVVQAEAGQRPKASHKLLLVAGGIVAIFLLTIAGLVAQQEYAKYQQVRAEYRTQQVCQYGDTITRLQNAKTGSLVRIDDGRLGVIYVAGPEQVGIVGSLAGDRKKFDVVEFAPRVAQIMPANGDEAYYTAAGEFLLQTSSFCGCSE